jgi:histone deacetylase 11
MNTSLFVKVLPKQWPIVYCPEYNIGFLGLERLHPFDAGKWGKVYGFLKGKAIFSYFIFCSIMYPLI